MMRFSVLSTMDISACPEVLDPLRTIAEIIEVPPDQDMLIKRISNADAYFASLHIQIDRAILEQADRLRVIASPSTGLDHIDLDFAKRRGIDVLSLKDDREFLRSVTATAELAWALILAVLRSIPWSFEAARSGEWARDRYRGHQLSGKTLGIIGFGRLGQHPLIAYARKHQNLVITPHIGGVTYESQQLAYGKIVEKLVAYLTKI